MPAQSMLQLPLEMYEAGVPPSDGRRRPDFTADRQLVLEDGEKVVWQGPITSITAEDKREDGYATTWKSSLKDDVHLTVTTCRFVYQITNVGRSSAGLMSGAMFGVAADAASGLVNRYKTKSLVVAGHVPIRSVEGIKITSRKVLIGSDDQAITVLFRYWGARTCSRLTIGVYKRDKELGTFLVRVCAGERLKEQARWYKVFAKFYALVEDQASNPVPNEAGFYYLPLDVPLDCVRSPVQALEKGYAVYTDDYKPEVEADIPPVFQ